MNDTLLRITEQTARQLEGLNRTDAKTALKNALKRLAGRGTAHADPVFWPAGMLLLGLWESGEESDYLDKWIADGARISYTDDALTGYVLVRLYEQTSDTKYLDAAGKVYAFLLSAPKDEKRSIIYHPEIGNQIIYADGAGMTALFLSAYARVTENNEAQELACIQLRNFFSYGMDDVSHLPYHAYDLATGEKLGIAGWGRAVGWLMMGLAETLYTMRTGMDPSTGSGPSTSSGAEQRIFSATRELEGVYGRMTGSIFSCLREDGSFSWQLPAMEGPSDTSGTAMIAWSLLRGNPRTETITESLQRIRDFLLSETKDGIVYGALAECIDYGQYRQVYGNYPWGQGAAAAFLHAYERMSL